VSNLRYYAGLELGMGAHPTALAVLERASLPFLRSPQDKPPAYSLRHLERYPPGTGYPAIIESVVSLLRKPPLPGSYLLIDYTGAGRPVCSLVIRGLSGQVDHTWTAVLLTAGVMESNPAAGEVHVAKTDLVSTVQVMLQTKRLLVSNQLAHASLFVRELENYRPKVALPKPDQIQWRDSQHDDLILAVALAAWGGERELRREARAQRRMAYQ
jgi:hypothetical protein